MSRQSAAVEEQEQSYASSDIGGKLLSSEQAEQICQFLLKNAKGGGRTEVIVSSMWHRSIKWARNRVRTAGDRQRQFLYASRRLGTRGGGNADTNQIDDTTIMNLLRITEHRDRLRASTRGVDDLFQVPPAELPLIQGPLWSDTTVEATSESRSELAKVLAESAEARGLISAGYVEVVACTFAGIDDVYGFRFFQYTNTRSSVTVRNPVGTGSGWAGISGFDWGRVDVPALAKRAIEKCVASIDAVRVEPGRYTVVLEPQAVSAIVQPLMASFARSMAENQQGPYTLGRDPATDLVMTKLGTRIVDERVTLYHDPAEVGTAVLPVPGLTSIKWIDRGVLTTLEDGTDTYARVNSSLPKRNENLPALRRSAYRMVGGETSVEEMIQTTRRGLLVTRFHGTTEIDTSSVLITGVTRDGLWLIENGIVTKAVRNMRFIESPLFVLNQLEQLGEPEPVFVPSILDGSALTARFEFILGPISAVVPPLKARDFNFASLVDAV